MNWPAIYTIRQAHKHCVPRDPNSFVWKTWAYFNKSRIYVSVECDTKGLGENYSNSTDRIHLSPFLPPPHPLQNNQQMLGQRTTTIWCLFRDNEHFMKWLVCDLCLWTGRTTPALVYRIEYSELCTESNITFCFFFFWVSVFVLLVHLNIYTDIRNKLI